MANGHGGARAGAGRKSKAEKFAPEIDQAERRLADRLPHILDKLEKLADGGLVEVTRKSLPAILVMKKDLVYDESGNPRNVEVPAFPDEANPKKLIVIEETRKTLAPDRAAGVYLADRVMGKPTQAVEMSGPEGGPVEVSHDPRLLTEEELMELEELLSKATPEGGGIGDSHIAASGG